ncbi:MAG: tetratricopeptide repeat protein [Candidatus Udaeobacter sp.]
MAKHAARKRKRSGVRLTRERPAPSGHREAALFGRVNFLIAAALAIVTLAIYGQVLGHQFISLDDGAYIKDNPMVNRGITLAGLGWAFTTFYAVNWHPLTWITHMIDSQLFGMNAGGHLLVNALIHVANTLLVFWFLLRTTHARWPSALVAALFALHPLHVESVAWAAELKDTLSTFFGLLSLIAYVRYAEAPSSSRYVWTAITLALGLLAKPMLVTWPFLMLLLDYWPLDRVSGQPARRGLGKGEWPAVRGLVVEKIPLFALVAASAVMTLIAQSHGGAVRTLARDPVALRLSNALVSYAKYLLLTIWPNDLAVYYPFAPTGIPVWQIIGAALLLIGITVFCLFQRKSAPYLIVGWLWFLGTLVPVIGLVQVGEQTMADRYFYIPSIGLFIAVVFGLADIAKNCRVAPSLSAVMASAVLLVLATLTNAQIRRWRDSFTLFEHALVVTPPNLAVENSLGHALAKSGRYDEAAVHFEKTLRIDPNCYDGLEGMGVTRALQGRLPEAIEHFQAAIRPQPHRASQLAPKEANTRIYLAAALAQLGRFPEAIEQLNEALRLNPNVAEAHNYLGLALLASGKARESIPEFEAALRLKPELKSAADNLRRAQAQLGSQR